MVKRTYYGNKCDNCGDGIKGFSYTSKMKLSSRRITRARNKHILRKIILEVTDETS